MRVLKVLTVFSIKSIALGLYLPMAASDTTAMTSAPQNNRNGNDFPGHKLPADGIKDKPGILGNIFDMGIVATGQCRSKFTFQVITAKCCPALLIQTDRCKMFKLLLLSLRR